MIDVEKNRGTPTLRVDGAFGDARGVAGPGTPAKNSGDLLEPEGGMASRVRGLRRPGGAVATEATTPFVWAVSTRRAADGGRQRRASVVKTICGTGHSTGRSVCK